MGLNVQILLRDGSQSVYECVAAAQITVHVYLLRDDLELQKLSRRLMQVIWSLPVSAE